MLQELLKALGVKQSVQVTVWDPDDEDAEFQFFSETLAVSGQYFLIAPPSGAQAEKLLSLMQSGLIVGIVLETPNNPYIFNPTIHSRQDTSPKGYWLFIPDDAQIESTQRRRHVRIEMEVPVLVQYAFGQTWLTVQARTEDVSGGGLKFITSKLFFKDQELRLEIQLNPELPVLKLKAKVVFVQKCANRKTPEEQFAVACQFYDVEDKDEMILVRECFRRELHSRSPYH